MTSRDLFDKLGAFGSDLSRWPNSQAEARAALISDRAFRVAHERERAFDRKLAAERDTLDRDLARSGALDRVRSRTLAGLPASGLAGIPWSRIAAAILVAGMLGGAVDMLLPAAPDEPMEVAIGDPLYSIGVDSE
jgi:hypothetical protein